MSSKSSTCIRRLHVGFSVLVAAGMLLACGGGGGQVGATADPAVSAQVQDVKPDNATETVGVFVALQSPTAAAGADAVGDDDAMRTQVQQQFLSDLLQAARQPVAGVDAGPTCDVASLQTKINSAYKPQVGLAVKLDLTACELDLLPKIPSVKGVYGDVPLQSQGASSAQAASINTAVTNGFNGITAWTTLNGVSANGAGRVIAVLDTGVEDRHPALSGKVLPGACFSTATNGGKSFCPNGSNVDTSSALAARSCAETWVSNPTSTDRAAAIAAGCFHGTGMAGAAAMSYSVGSVSAAGMAKGAQILPVQVFSKTISGTQTTISASSSDLLAGIEWVTAQAQSRVASSASPIVALNMSLGGGTYTGACDSGFYVGSLFKQAFDKLRAQGVLPVVAAGNDGQRAAISFPACVSNALPVAAAQLGYTGIASYSNFSAQVKVVAQGGDTNGAYSVPTLCANRSSQGDDCWSSTAGTSPATALVSGAVAALSSSKSGLTPAQIEASLSSNWVGTSYPSAKLMTDSRVGAVPGVSKPALRLTANVYQLSNLTEASASSAVPVVSAPAPAPVVSGGTVQVCFYRYASYQGSPACATHTYGTNQPVTLTYNYLDVARSISIRELSTGTPLPANTITATVFTSVLASTGKSYAVDTPDTASNAIIRKIQIAYP